jgi:hypothetical protein
MLRSVSDADDSVGLCCRCLHARIVRTPRSTFWRCALAETDARFDRYPRLPVIRCDGFAASAAAPVEPPSGGAAHEAGPDDDPSGP